MRKGLLYASLAIFSAYVSAGAILWAAQTHLIFEPLRTLVVAPAELGFPVADITIPVRGETLHAWWMSGSRADDKLILYFHGNDGNVSTSVSKTALLREQRSGDEKERRLFHERLAGERRNDPVAGSEDVVHEAEGVRLVGLPEIAAKEARREPHRDEQRERQAFTHG